MALNAKANPTFVPISEANALKHLLKLSLTQMCLVFSEPGGKYGL
jgi:hypothetical protein